MGTRGLYGFILNGIYYLMYVHYDGDMLMSVMKREAYVILKYYGSIENVKKEFGEIKWRTCGLNPTKKEIELLEPWTNLEVENRTTKSWYCLLHYCQKSLIHTLESGYILLHDNKPPTTNRPDYSGFMCWWNLDSNTIEFYDGEELIQKLEPYVLIKNKPKNFPIKTLDKIIENFYNLCNENKNELEKQNKLLNFTQELNIPNELFSYNNISQEDMKKLLIEEIEISIKHIKSNSCSKFINLLWVDLGVIHYE